MNKKIIIILIILVIIINITIISISKLKKENKYIENIYKIETSLDYNYDEENNRYIIYDQNRNIRGYARDESEFKMWEENLELNLENLPDNYFKDNNIIEDIE